LFWAVGADGDVIFAPDFKIENGLQVVKQLGMPLFCASDK
jgi:hypothetical protein